ncbi:hypothetical protein CYK37_24505 [Mesorhizobium loti]|nr:hypothetical protein CYK37_24505 [Mesorhizobium loti]
MARGDRSRVDKGDRAVQQKCQDRRVAGQRAITMASVNIVIDREEVNIAFEFYEAQSSSRMRIGPSPPASTGFSEVMRMLGKIRGSNASRSDFSGPHRWRDRYPQ